MADVAGNDPRVHFAAERTFLAWIRTVFSLMGFEFCGGALRIVSQRNKRPHPELGVKSYGFSLWAGSAMVLLGAMMNLGSSRAASRGDPQNQSWREHRHATVVDRDRCRNRARISGHRNGRLPAGGELSDTDRSYARTTPHQPDG